MVLDGIFIAPRVLDLHVHLRPAASRVHSQGPRRLKVAVTYSALIIRSCTPSAKLSASYAFLDACTEMRLSIGRRHKPGVRVSRVVPTTTLRLTLIRYVTFVGDCNLNR